jgi:class 3 adenylate cyclase
MRLRMTLPRGVDPRIVILDIDEKSLGEIGRWPWSRKLMAELVDKLFERYGVALLGFDVVWAERDPSSGIDELDTLARTELKASPEFKSAYARLRPRLDFDARFAASLKGRPVVLGYYFNSEDRAVRVNALPEPVLPKGSFAERNVLFFRWQGYTGNLPIYLEHASGAGHINPIPDADGVLRRVPLLVEYEGEYYEAFALAMLRSFLALGSGEPPRVQPGFPPDDPNLEWLNVGSLQIPVDESAAALVPFRGAKYSFATIYTMNMAYGYFVESRSKRRLAGRFREYVPPEVVAKMELDPDSYDKPKNAELTILFSDIRGFTSISEALSPEALREYINAYLTEMSLIIRSRYRGTLDKYIGDAIMAFWGAPLNARLAARGWPALAIGVGVNSGTVRVGDMGSRIRRAYTAMGDAVNVASRLEGRTKIYGVGILVGEATRSRVKDVVFREIDRVKVKGKDEAITIYEPLGLEGDNEQLQLWDEALRAYRAQQWGSAETSLLSLQRMNPGCGLYGAYLKKIQEKRREPPPPGWDGVTVFDEK